MIILLSEKYVALDRHIWKVNRISKFQCLYGKKHRLNCEEELRFVSVLRAVPQLMRVQRLSAET